MPPKKNKKDKLKEEPDDEFKKKSDKELAEDLAFFKGIQYNLK